MAGCCVSVSSQHFKSLQLSKGDSNTRFNHTRFKMARIFSLLFLFVSLTAGSSFTYSLPTRQANRILTSDSLIRHKNKQQQQLLPLLAKIRGGSDNDKKESMIKSVSSCIQSKSAKIAALTSSSLLSGPYGVLALWGVASAVVVPLTLYRQAYSFSVGYGYSVMAMALTLLKTFAPMDWKSSSHLLAVAAAVYGFRLGTFLSIRNIFNKSKGREMKNFDKTPRLQRIPFAVGVALFYSFMMCPAMYALRAPPDVGTIASKIAYSGVGIAFTGALLEAIADGHKFYVKQKYGATDIFVGPTGGVYRICRHPNYLGEIMFWTGMVVGGAPSFGKSITAWVCSLLGLYGIVGIMRNATSRLDKKQQEKYKGQDAYDLWTQKVKAPLVPFVTGSSD